MPPNPNQCKHTNIITKDDYTFCDGCGLLKSTIEAMEKPSVESSKLEWRLNLHKTIVEALINTDSDYKIPQIVIDAIDAAYVAGLDNKESSRLELEWLGHLIKANSVLRSAHEIALRKGKDTNWDAFLKTVEKELTREHKLIYPNKAGLEDGRKENLK